MDWFLYDGGLRHERVNNVHISYIDISFQRCISVTWFYMKCNTTQSILRFVILLQLPHVQGEKESLKMSYWKILLCYALSNDKPTEAT